MLKYSKITVRHRMYLPSTVCTRNFSSILILPSLDKVNPNSLTKSKAVFPVDQTQAPKGIFSPEFKMTVLPTTLKVS